MNLYLHRDGRILKEADREEVNDMVSARGGRWGFVYRSRQSAYRALRRQGMGKSKAARIANEGQTRAGRSLMARKAARTRQAKGK